MLFADCGTTYTKILNTETQITKIKTTRDILKNNDIHFDAATGHLGKIRADYYQNELVCLAKGSIRVIESDTFCVVDIGGRDTKLVEYRNGKPQKLDWNTSCGANTGFTLEIVGKYFGVDFDQLESDDDYVNVTCGVLGLESVFDALIAGVSQDRAVARFVHGIARNIHRLIGRKDSFYLSGGLTENRCFMTTMRKYADVTSLGRTLILKGLQISYRDKLS